MKLYLDCMSCIVGNVVSTTTRFVVDEEKRYKIIQECIKELGDLFHHDSSAPILTGKYNQIIMEAIGIEDIYEEEKELFNNEMLALESSFEKIIESSGHPIRTAILLSGAANIIDNGIVRSLNKEFVKDKIINIVERNPYQKDIDVFLKELKNSNTLLYVGDNCGEAVLDKLVLKYMKNEYPNLEIYYVVRDAPILNDVTMKEAHEIGIDKYAKVISSGSKIPGTIIKSTPIEFQRLYKKADMKLFKGMGNLETAEKDELDSYYIFMVKCDFLAEKLDASLHDVILTKGNPL